jgi:gliding motility-associated-like protein
MSRSYITSIGVVMVCLLTTLSSYAQLTNAGKDFWLAFTETFDKTTSVYQINISGNIATTGTVEIPGTSFLANYSVSPGVVTKVTVPAVDATIVGSEFITARGIHVTANDEVVVYANSYHNFRSEASLVLPTPSLGKEYMAITHESQMNSGLTPSEFMIVCASTTDSLVVEINTAGNTLGGRLANTPWQVTLQPGEIYQVQGGSIADDMTGSVIKSLNGQAFAVFCGNEWSHVSCTGTMDPLYEAVFPINTWGKDYFMVPTPHRSHDDFRVLAAFDTTVVFLNGVPVDTLNRSEFYEGSYSVPTLVNTTKPSTVASFLITGTCDGFRSDPAFIVLAPNEQMFLDTVTFYTISEFRIDSNFVTVVCRTADTMDMWFNGSKLYNFQTFAADPLHAWKVFQVDTGSHTLTTATCGFLAYVTGHGYAESYAYAAGVLLRDLTKNWTFSNMSSEGMNICEGDSIQFSSATNETPLWFRWDFGNGDTSDLEDPLYAYDSGGVYPFELIIQYECRADTLRDTVTILEVPSVDLGPDQYICPGDIVNLNANNPGVTYQWSTGDTVQAISVTDEGPYSVSVWNGVCTDFDEMEVIWSIPEVDAGLDFEITKCQYKELHASSNSNVQFEWSPPDGLIDPQAARTDIATEVNQVYTVTVTDSIGCTNSDSLSVNVSELVLLELPNAFSPNGDGVNDVIYPIFQCVDIVDFKIMNRVGNIVYHSTDPFEGWDGSFKGKVQPVDTYVYYIIGEAYNGEPYHVQGNITLIK